MTKNVSSIMLSCPEPHPAAWAGLWLLQAVVLAYYFLSAVLSAFVSLRHEGEIHLSSFSELLKLLSIYFILSYKELLQRTSENLMKSCAKQNTSPPIGDPECHPKLVCINSDKIAIRHYVKYNAQEN